MSADLTDPRAYKQVAAYIRQQISDRSLAVGDPAPSLTILVGESGHSRDTVRKAMRVLEREGLVARYAGLGYYVASSPGAEDPGGHRTTGTGNGQAT